MSCLRHLAGFHGFCNVFAASLRREDCQGPLPYGLGHLVGWPTLHNASAIFSVTDDGQGSNFRVWRLLVGVSTLYNVAQSVFFAITLRKGGVLPPMLHYMQRSLNCGEWKKAARLAWQPGPIVSALFQSSSAIR